MDKISIIVPVYNVYDYIDKCIESIVCQTYQNLEIILVDDGSTDGSGEKCDRWKQKDKRVKVIHKENGGVSSTRNVGLDNATGRYIMFVDSDDFCENTYAEKLYNTINNSNSEIAFCSYLEYYTDRIKAFQSPFETGTYDIRQIFNTLFFGAENDVDKNMFTALWIGIFRRDIIIENNIKFDTETNFAEDFLFYAEYTKHCKKAAIINESLYYYVQRASSLVHTEFITFDKKKIQNVKYTFERFYDIIKANGCIDEERYIKYYLKKYVNQCLFYIVNIYNAAGHKGIKEVYGILKYIMEETRLNEKIKKTDIALIKSWRYRITARVVATGNKPLIMLWVGLFDAVKKVRKMVKKVGLT